MNTVYKKRELCLTNCAIIYTTPFVKKNKWNKLLTLSNYFWLTLNFAKKDIILFGYKLIQNCQLDPVEFKHLMSEQRSEHVLQFVLSITILTLSNKSEDTLKFTNDWASLNRRQSLKK